MKYLLLVPLIAARYPTQVFLHRSGREYHQAIDHSYQENSRKDTYFGGLDFNQNFGAMVNDEPFNVREQMRKDLYRRTQRAHADIYFHRSDGTTRTQHIEADNLDELHQTIKHVYYQHGMKWIEPSYNRKVLLTVTMKFGGAEEHVCDKHEEWSELVDSVQQELEIDTEFKRNWNNYFDKCRQEHNVSGNIKFHKTTSVSSMPAQSHNMPRPSAYGDFESQNVQLRNSLPNKNQPEIPGKDKNNWKQLCKEKRETAEVKTKCIRAKKKKLAEFNSQILPHQVVCHTHCHLKQLNGVYEVSKVTVTAKLARP